jgi:hypothetical protein
LTIELNIRIRSGKQHELNTAFSLLENAALRLGEDNIDYWQEWLNPPEEYIAWIKLGFINNEFYFIENAGSEIVGMFRLQFEDEIFWGKREDKAGYIHSFTIDRSLSGNRAGYGILRRIEKFLIAKGTRILRLDCPPGLGRLCKYYEDFGFAPQGITTVFNDNYLLYEKKISEIIT